MKARKEMAGRTELGTYDLTLVGTGRGGETAAHPQSE
jgi:hypothetical protein